MSPFSILLLLVLTALLSAVAGYGWHALVNLLPLESQEAPLAYDQGYEEGRLLGYEEGYQKARQELEPKIRQAFQHGLVLQRAIVESEAPPFLQGECPLSPRLTA